MKNPQISREHHYVPEALMKPWASANGILNGYWWNSWKRRLDCKKLGAKGFCYEIGLLMLEGHEERPDVLEQVFFAEIDTDGCAARDRMLQEGPASLSNEQKCDFASPTYSRDDAFIA